MNDSPSSGHAFRKEVVASLLSIPTILGVCSTAVLLSIGIVARDPLILFFSSGAAFILGVTISELLFIPRITILLASGILFHPMVGAAYTVAGDLVAALIVWHLGRHSFGKRLGIAVLGHPRAGAIRPVLHGEYATLTIATLRVLPFSHFSSVSLLSGTLRVPLGKFMMGTLAGCIPTALAYPFIARGVLTVHPLTISGAALALLLCTGGAAWLLLRMKKRHETK